MTPNILFIMADQFRADALGVVGGYTKTPNLDRLAARGTLFRNAFANSAECIPSRVSLATGLYPHETKVDRNMRHTLDPGLPNWIRCIRDVGYETSIFGKTHFHPHEGDLRDRLPLMHAYGFQIIDETTGPRAAAYTRSGMTDEWQAAGALESFKEDLKQRYETKPFVARPSPLPLNLYYDCYVARKAREYIEFVDSAKNWFCWVSFAGPHEPWDAPEAYARLYSDAAMPEPRRRAPDNWKGLVGKRLAEKTYSPLMSPQEIQALRRNYAASVTLIDDEIGKIIQLLERRGMIDRTLIVFVSDHGEMNGDYGLVYKANFLDPAIKIPMLIVPPPSPLVDLGRCCDELVELMDVGATLIDYAQAGGSTNAAFGVSLKPIVDGRDFVPHSFVRSEFAGHCCIVTTALKVEFTPLGEVALAFDRILDPEESVDVSKDPKFEQALRTARAFAFAERDPDRDLASTPWIRRIGRARHRDRFSLWITILTSLRPQFVLEIGVWRGEFAERILRVCPSIRQYFMIDPWRHLKEWNKPFNVEPDTFEQVFSEAMRRTEFASPRRKVLRGKTPEVIDRIADESLDFVYVDGDHTLRGITADLILAFKKIRPGGMLCGDDYCDSIWQHSEEYEPSLVNPFAAYFAEAVGAPLVILPFNQYALVKPREGERAFAIFDTTSSYGPRNLLRHVQRR
jgi:arylsulfatase